jgi:predicted transposase YbfD/YdcC
MLKETFSKHFESITDTRQEGKVQHSLMTVFFIAVAGYIASCEKWDTIIFWANHNKEWLKNFVDITYGIPSESTFHRVFASIDPKEFERRFIGWTKELAIRFKNRSIAIDGKTLCGAKESAGAQSLFHIVSAWASDSGLTLGFLRTNEKSNEITAIPELLKLLSIEGDVVTIDAMGAQTEIARQIVEENKADYVFGLKANQPSMFDDTVLFFTGVDRVANKDNYSKEELGEAVKISAESIAHQFRNGLLSEINEEKPVFLDYEYQYKMTKDIGHGRIEYRQYVLVPDVSWLSRNDEWPGLKSVGMVISTTINKKTSEKSIDCRFFISSLDDVDRFASSVRSHWGCESAHWVLDVTFSEDKNLSHTDNGPENKAFFRRLAYNLLKVERDNFIKENPKKKISYSTLRYKSAVDINFLEKVMISNLV